ncbi:MULTISPECIES: sporulation protein YjcZ [Paenibacillus]|nr:MULTISPECIES: sporulation protein YjcZ [Paenibacillus]
MTNPCCPQVAPVAAAPVCGLGTSTATILVLYILLVIILRTFWV